MDRTKTILRAGALAALAASCAPLAQKKQQPNFLFILMDDMGYSDISCYGENRWSTPHIDSLAREGIRFTNCYAASPISSPSRAGFLTGRYPGRMGIQEVFYPDSYTGMAPEETTLAEILKPMGYSTSYIGKWHLGSREKFLPLQQGFDEYYGIPYSNDMTAQVLLRGNEVEEFHIDIDNLTRNYTREAVSFLDSHKKGGPFLMVLAHSMMHVPIYVSEAFRGKSGAGIYGDAVLEGDWGVGEVMAALRRNGLDENTVVVFTSDNGPWLQEGPLGGRALPLREGKTTAFEGGVRVPCIVWWKGHVLARECDDVVSLLDWMPTVSALTGANLPKADLDGYDLSAVLDGTGKRASEDYAYFHNNAELTNYRSGDWKLTLPFKQIDGNFWRTTTAAHDTLLFNLREDPSERYNLFHKYPEKVKELAAKADAFKKRMGALPEPMVVTGNYPGQYLRDQRQRAREDAIRQGFKPQKETVEGFIDIQE